MCEFVCKAIINTKTWKMYTAHADAAWTWPLFLCFFPEIGS